MKAATRATKIRRKKGRPPKEGVLRTESGRISTSKEAEEWEQFMSLEVATWKRRQEHPDMGVFEARLQEIGSVIHAWRHASDQYRKRHGDGRPNPNEFSEHHFLLADRITEVYERYRIAVAVRGTRSSTDFSGPGGFDGTDPFDADRARADERAIKAWTDCRKAILESGPFSMMAVEAIVFENRPQHDLLADLRVALNAVDRMWRMSKAA